jgi:hypothetical protein
MCVFFRKRRSTPSLCVSDPGADLPKPLNLIVLTDGEADDEQEVEEYLVETARTLDELGAPKSHIGIQFVQVGDDVEAAEYLRRLDDDLKNLHQNRGIRHVS